jgi:hypothetical protein
MKFNSHFFSFPPHISTTWKQVAALTMNPAGHLEIAMHSGEKISLPPLSAEETDRIFQAYASHLEKTAAPDATPVKRELPPHPFGMDFPKILAFPLQHSPTGQEDPGFTEEMIQQIAEIAKNVIPKEHLESFKAEPGCHCTYCEIARAAKDDETETLDSAPLTDLPPLEWVVTPMGNKLYNVSHINNPQENYRVHLGTPIGCTCGQTHCPHILSVLKS